MNLSNLSGILTEQRFFRKLLSLLNRLSTVFYTRDVKILKTLWHPKNAISKNILNYNKASVNKYKSQKSSKKFKKLLDKPTYNHYNISATQNGCIAQLARAFGSYPECHWFESNYSHHHGPVVKRPKTPPFHGGNTGSNPVRVTKTKREPSQ